MLEEREGEGEFISTGDVVESQGEREGEGEFISTGDVVESQGEREGEQGPASIDVTDKQILLEESVVVAPQEENLQEQNRGIEQVQEEFKISKKEQKRRRITSYLTDISKKVEKQGNQINKIITMIQSVQKQRQTKPITGIERVSHSQLQSIKQIQSQLSQLQKQVIMIQKEIQKVRTASTKRTSASTKRTKAKVRKPSSATSTASTSVKSRSKKSKSLKSNKARKGRRGIK